MSLVTLDAAPLVEPVAGGWQLVIAALLAIGLIVVLITWPKVHPFLALILGGLTVGMVAGREHQRRHHQLLHRLRYDGRGRRRADRARRHVRQAAGRLRRRRPDRRHDRRARLARGLLPWAMAGVGALIGLPMFFEIGLVMLMPVIYLVARRAQMSVITDRYPHAGRPVGHARTGAAAPRPAGRDRHPRRRPRYDADARRPRRHPDRDRGRSAVRQVRRSLGRRTAAAPVRGS